MKYVEATSNQGNKIQVQPITKKIDVTPLDAEFSKEWEEILVGVIVNGQRIELNLDGTFHHPVTEEVYEVNY